MCDRNVSVGRITVADHLTHIRIPKGHLEGNESSMSAPRGVLDAPLGWQPCSQTPRRYVRNNMEGDGDTLLVQETLVRDSIVI